MIFARDFPLNLATSSQNETASEVMAAAEATGGLLIGAAAESHHSRQ